MCIIIYNYLIILFSISYSTYMISIEILQNVKFDVNNCTMIIIELKFIY